jgi:ParB family transcriptional regulator, chromosome partitioning protein
MIKFDALKDFDVAALGRDAPVSTGQPRELPVERIHPDPDNVRTHCTESSVAELAETIRTEGLLQAITVRHHPTKRGSYLISYGERRWRAVRLLGLPTIAAVINESFDPYCQVIENLQREELTPMQLAKFVAKREATGESRTIIAKRLGKSKSFITEVAHLAQAPAAIRRAFERSRIDTRTAYLLARHYADRPEQIKSWLAGKAPVSRALVKRELGTVRRRSSKTLSLRSKSYNALGVLVGGRPGTLVLRPGSVREHATVYFTDGREEVAPLREVTLTHWLRI